MNTSILCWFILRHYYYRNPGCAFPLSISSGIILSGFVASSRYSSVWFFFIVPPASGTFHPETGNYFIDSFLPEDYNALGQNTSLIQAPDGDLLVTNLRGLLTYDGVRWELVQHDRFIQPLSLTMDDQSRIYVGYEHDLVVLEEDIYGTYQTHSLMGFLPDSITTPSSVWSAFSTPRGIYFEGWEYIFRWEPANAAGDSGSMKFWSFPEEEYYSTISYAMDNLWLFQKSVGIGYINEGDSITFVEDFSEYDEIYIYEIIPFAQDKMLIVGHDDNDDNIWMVYDNSEFREVTFPAAQYAEIHGCTFVCRLKNNLYSISTELGGVAFFDSTGTILHVLSRESGLPDELCNEAMLDNENAVWLPLDFGLSRVELNSPLTYFDGSRGLYGNIYEITQFQNRTVVATDNGLFYLQIDDNCAGQAHFRRIENFDYSCTDIKQLDDILVVSTDDGIFRFTSIPGSPRAIVENDYSEFVEICPEHNRVYYGSTYNGLRSLLYRNGRFVDEGFVEQVEGEIRDAFFASDGKLWLTIDNDHLEYLQIVQHNPSESDTVIHVFNDTNGLPSPDYFYPFEIDNQIYVSCTSGIYKYIPESDSFEKSEILLDAEANNITAVYSPKVDQQGNLWFDTFDHAGICAVPTGDGTFRLTFPFESAGYRRGTTAISLTVIMWCGPEVRGDVYCAMIQVLINLL